MPRDSWKRANQRKKYGHIGPTTVNSFGPNSIMAFGKYRGTRVADLPLDYVRWMIEDFRAESPNTQSLVDYLAITSATSLCCF